MPGRLRLDIAGMVSNPALAEAIEDVVRGVGHVRGARANPISGSLLVTYDPGIASIDFPAMIRSEIEAWLMKFGSSIRSVAGARRSALSRVLEISGQRPGKSLVPALLSVCAHSLTTVQNLSLALIITVAMGGSPGVLKKVGLTDARSQLKALTAAAMLLTIPGLLAHYSRRKAWRRLSQTAEYRLRAEVFTQLEAQDLTFFEEHGTGQLVALLTDDVRSIGTLLEEGDDLINSMLTILFAGGALVRVSPFLALAAGLSVPLLLFPIRLLRPKSQEAFSQRADVNARLNQGLENILAGIVEVKSFTAEDIEAQRVRDLGQDLAELSVRSTLSSVLQTEVTGSLFFWGYAPAFSYSARRMLSEKRPEENQLMRTGFWFPRLVEAVRDIQDSRSAYYGARAAAEQLCGVLDSKPRIRDGATRLGPANLRGEIAMESVSFGYDPSTPVLHNVSFHLPAGQTLGIVGPTGSGKSTLLRLLLRFYEPDFGRIFLDGHDLKDLRVQDVREAIALVSQDVYLFNGSVLHNVLYGQPSATNDVVRAALAAAGAQDLLDSLPQGLETEVGERGHRLSGGQRQRVAIARALLKAAPILALDEATSHLDYATEAAVRVSLKNATSGKTVLLIAHRLSSVRDADNIIVLDRGTVREQGSHQDLLNQRGLYFDLWRLQS